MLIFLSTEFFPHFANIATLDSNEFEVPNDQGLENYSCSIQRYLYQIWMFYLCGVIEVETHMEPDFYHIFDFFSKKMYVQLNKFPYFYVALYGPDICAKWFFPSPCISKVISNFVLKSALKFDSRYWQLFFLFYLNIFLFFDHIYIWFGDIWANFFFHKKFKKLK